MHYNLTCISCGIFITLHQLTISWNLMVSFHYWSTVIYNLAESLYLFIYFPTSTDSNTQCHHFSYNMQRSGMQWLNRMKLYELQLCNFLCHTSLVYSYFWYCWRVSILWISYTQCLDRSFLIVFWSYRN